MALTSERRIWELLSLPFNIEEISLRAIATTKDRSRGLVAPYVSSRTIMKRLDEVADIDGWHDRYESIGSNQESVFVKCSLTIDGVTKEDIGSGTDYKSACSDSLKRAAVKFGIGRYLYDVEKPWAALDQRGAIVNEKDVKARILRNAIPERAEANGSPVLDGGSLRR